LDSHGLSQPSRHLPKIVVGQNRLEVGVVEDALDIAPLASMRLTIVFQELSVGDEAEVGSACK
jgi:hypothetical protein